MNIFDAINDLHTDAAKFAYRDLGSAAAIHTVIGVRNHLAKLKAGSVDEDGNVIEEAQPAGEELNGDEHEDLMREEQGNPPAQPPLHRAQHLNSIRLACNYELRTLGVMPPTRREDEPKVEYAARVEAFKQWNWPQNPASVLRFFQSADGKTPTAAAESFDRLVEKKILTRDQADEAIRADKQTRAKQWADIAEDVLIEIKGFDEAEDPVGTDAFEALEPWMQLRLYDDTIKRLKGSCSRFVARVALGREERNGTQRVEAEAIGFLLEKEQDKLVKARREFYKLHGAAIEARQSLAMAA